MESLVKLRMKKLFFLVLAFVAISCSSDSEPQSVEYLLPVESIDGPTEAFSGETVTFLVNYRRPTDCHLFNGFYVDNDGTSEVIAVRSLKFEQGNCMDDSDNVYTVPFEFTPNAPGTYRFKFWHGNSQNEVATYLEYELFVE